MTKSTILYCVSYFFFACHQNAEISQDKPPVQNSEAQTVENQQIRMKKISEIYLKENEKAYIGTIEKIKVDANRIYLMDKSLKQVLIFSMAGEFVRAFGRSGEGPGEFRFLYTMDVKDHLIACFDQGNRRMTLFDTSGVFIRSFGTQSQKSVPSGNRIAITQHYTILHCQKPKGLPKKQWQSYSYPYLICEFDTLGNVLSHHGKFNQQIVGDKLEKPLTEFKWSFPHFIATRDSQTYLWFNNLPVVVEYDKRHSVSKVFNVATPITKPKWVDKEAENDKEAEKYLSRKEKMNLAIQRIKNQHYIVTFLMEIAYVDKYSLLLTLQTEEERRGLSLWTRSHHLSAYDVNTGYRLVIDMPLQPEPEASVMFQSITVDADGFVYCIQNDQPDNFVIAKYEIIREEI